MIYDKYPAGNGVMYPIHLMSKAYLKTAIAFIKESGVNEKYLESLEKEYKKKSLIKFKNITNL